MYFLVPKPPLPHSATFSHFTLSLFFLTRSLLISLSLSLLPFLSSFARFVYLSPWLRFHLFPFHARLALDGFWSLFDSVCYCVHCIAAFWANITRPKRYTSNSSSLSMAKLPAKLLCSFAPQFGYIEPELWLCDKCICVCVCAADGWATLCILYTLLMNYFLVYFGIGSVLIQCNAHRNMLYVRFPCSVRFAYARSCLLWPWVRMNLQNKSFAAIQFVVLLYTRRSQYEVLYNIMLHPIF